jgi:paraquat-inducible protein B
LRTGTKVWVEQAELSLAGVKNAETLVFGSYLNILPGEGALCRHFTARSKAPLAEIAARDGLGLILETPRLGSLAIGSPVYYRQLQVGEVAGYEFSPSFRTVQVMVTIERPYIPLIRHGTRFWQVSGTKLSGGIFSGINFSAESLTAILRGGIALATPEKPEAGPAVSAGHRFALHDDPEEQWLQWNPDILHLDQAPAKGVTAAK